MISMRIKNVDPKCWYDIPGYDGIYQINYWADIRKKLGNGKYKHLKPYVKKNNQGKRLIKLKRKEVVVMSLMRITFIGDLPKGYVTYHKNGIKTDDILGNIGVITKKELSKKTGQMNGRATKVAKINQDGEIVAFYKSAREAARQNYMSYQTILDRINGKVKGIYAPDGYAYCKDSDKEITEMIRKIERKNTEECGANFIKAPEVVFEF